MREVNFHKQNIAAWREFEETIQNRRELNADKLAELFIRITDDLAYARTHYPDSATTKYLNGLATTVHLKIYKNKSGGWKQLFTFWIKEVPLASYMLRKHIFLAFIIFSLAVGIAVLSQAYDKTFVSMFLGDGYVEMTKENIAKGDPLGVYHRDGALESFLLIVWNNMRLMIIGFALGIFFCLGSIYFLFRNSIMVGVFEYFLLKDEHVAFGTNLLVWVHGTFEISALVLSSAAGIALGYSILFPGTYTRSQSLRRAAYHAIILMASLLPIITIAAIFEGFVTRHTKMPLLFSGTMVLLTFSFIVFYYLIYPRKVKRKYGQSILSQVTEIQGYERSDW